jgi:hypothetical protein
MHDLMLELAQKNQLIPVVAVIGGLIVAAIWVIFSTVRSMVVGSAKEKTKQELAAYVAAGSLDPDKAVAMINAGKTDEDSCT